MRTTIMFEPELMRSAKAKSAERGESLKALMTRAVEAELGRSDVPSRARARVLLPLFGSDTGPFVRLSNADIEAALAAEDAAAAPVRPSKASRNRPAAPRARTRRSP